MGRSNTEAIAFRELLEYKYLSSLVKARVVCL
jgi:hypothetical protein